jgi:PAS domain S-box-containing protein
LLDTAQDAVLVTLAEPLDSPGPLIVFANQSLLDQTGYGHHEVLGRSPRLFQGPETCRDSTARLRRAMDQWQPSRMQVLNYRRDGSTCWIDLKVAPLADPTGWHTHALAERLYAGAPIA